MGKVDGIEGDRDDTVVGNGDNFSCSLSSFGVSFDK